jgi:hypothetical protein
MQTYARQGKFPIFLYTSLSTSHDDELGGTSAIFICDDGMQCIPEADQNERIAFYANHNIGWVARPPHSSSPEGFKRAGKFKKASKWVFSLHFDVIKQLTDAVHDFSMNYGLQLSLKLEKFLAQRESQGAGDDGDDCLEDQAMRMAQEEMYEESGKKWKPRCANGKSLRVGEIILIIDSDTVVPEVCFEYPFL